MNGPEMGSVLNVSKWGNGESCGHLAGTRKLREREGGKEGEV